MAKMTTLKEPLKKHPNICMGRDDIEIIADHYGYDYAECRVICGYNNDQIAMMGYCLINNDGDVVDDIESWEQDEILLKKYYQHDLKYGFIENNISFEEYIKPYSSS